MLCWSCGKEIADDAKRCEHCEADVLPLPGDAEMDTARNFLENMDPNVKSELLHLFASSESGEQFVNRIMIGDCPQCGSTKTGDCEHDPDITDVTIGRCFDCGHIWCTICDSPLAAGQKICEVCDELEDGLEEDIGEDRPPLDRDHLLAAEVFGYSFANYRSHLGIGNVRFEELMPNTVRMLETALHEGWPASRVAREMDPEDPMPDEEAQSYLDACKRALLVVDAEDPSEAFRHAIRQCVQRAADEGLDDAEAVENLVTQICYRVSDLSVLLELDGQLLSRYSRHLRRENNVEYYDGYFDEMD